MKILQVKEKKRIVEVTSKFQQSKSVSVSGRTAP